jgi:hypothetical protein
LSDRWLTFEELCDELRLKPFQVRRLIKNGKVVGICHGKNPRRLETDWRYLDPTPKYKRALSLLEHMTSNTLEIDLGEFPVIGSAEFAELCGFSQDRVRGLIHRKVLKPYKVGKYSLFTPQQLRDFLRRREGSINRYKRPSMATLLDWCMRYAQGDRARYITRDQVRRDDELEGEIRQILRLPEPERSRAMRTFWRRYELAKEFSRAFTEDSGTAAHATSDGP